jgi:hypothetical protein
MNKREVVHEEAFPKDGKKPVSGKVSLPNTGFLIVC